MIIYSLLVFYFFNYDTLCYSLFTSLLIFQFYTNTSYTCISFYVVVGAGIDKELHELMLENLELFKKWLQNNLRFCVGSSMCNLRMIVTSFLRHPQDNDYLIRRAESAKLPLL